MSHNGFITSIGDLPDEQDSFKARMRFHQAWWRTAVLVVPPGPHPNRKKADKTIGNTIEVSGNTSPNFISEAAYAAYLATLSERHDYKAGLFNQERLMGNLLSSQPLCFNFFGELKQDANFAKTALQKWLPDLGQVDNVRFEFAPREQYTKDHSAFDVAFEYLNRDGKRCLLGLECKYTDSFSAKEYDTYAYREMFRQRRGTFLREYGEYVKSRYNQLFRNQLIAESLILNGRFDSVSTGLFCHQADERALEIGKEFQGMLSEGDNRFVILTQFEFISALQRLDLSPERREWTMNLWARYSALSLSENIFDKWKERTDQLSAPRSNKSDLDRMDRL